MKALLVEHGEDNHPQTTLKVRKIEADNIFAEG